MIELLVVITIIGILVTIAIASFQTAQAKARDSRRKTDLDAFKKALELYKSDTAGGLYPACASAPAGPCKITVNADFSQTGGVGSNQSTTPYFGNSFPKDSKNSGNCNGTPASATYYAGNIGLAYCYWPQGAASGGAGDEQYPGYIITACLENSSDRGDNTYDNVPANCVSASDDRTYGFSNP